MPPGTYVDENGDLVTFDPATGDIISTQPAGSFGDTGPTGATGASGATGATGGAGASGSILIPPSNQYMPGFDPNGLPLPPDQDPTNPAYKGYQGLGNKPPWITAGYGNFKEWSNAVGEQKAADIAYRQSQNDLLLKQIAAQNSGNAASTTNARIGAQTAANSLAEQKRQFDSNYANAQTPAERAALLAEQQRQFDQGQALSKGNTLLGLGSRPDTLIKYLYALRGQQTPQGIDNTGASIPGYGNQPSGPAPTGGGAPGPAPVAAPAATAPAAAPAADPRVTAVKQAIATPGAPLGGFVAPGGTNITQGNPGQAPTTLQGQATATQGATAEQQGQQDKLISEGRKPKFYSGGVAIFKHGGPIPEHVIGVGLESGKTYEFGEAGDEFVVPHDKMKDLMGLLGKDMLDRQGTTDASGNKSYAAGGTIGFTPSADQQKYIQDQVAQTASTNAAFKAPSAAPSMAAPAPSAASALTPVAPPTQPTQADTAMIGGVKTWAGGAYSGMPVASSPSNAGDLTPYLKNPNAADPTGRVAPSSALTPVQPVAQPIAQPVMNMNPGGRSIGQNPNISGPAAMPSDMHSHPIPQPALGFGGPVPMPYFGNPGFGVPGGEIGSGRALPGAPLQGYVPQTGAIGNNFAGNTPSLGSQSAGFFNDPRLQGIVARGYNSNPATPLFPQIGIATNGGQSLIPSAQRLNSLSPAEQGLYSGALQDEFGAQPGDVFDMARRLAPQVSGLRTPKFAG